MNRLAFLGAVLFPASLAAQVSAFRHDPGRVPVGAVFHYLKTNLDGSHPEHIVQYVAGPDRLEVFKFQAPGARAALVTAWMDWRIFSAARLETQQVWRDSTRGVATLTYDTAASVVAVSVFGRSERLTISGLPFHVYNFDLGSLNLSMAHLRDPAGRFTVTLTDPTYRDAPVFRERGPVEVRYVEDVIRDGQDCRLYRIDGPGLEDKGGWIWVRKGDGFAQDIEIALPDNPSWNSFKLRLEKRGQMTPAEWDQFRRNHFTR